MDQAKCAALKNELAPLGEPVIIRIERFFDGNDDEASMGCNLFKHPGIETFRRILTGLALRPDVEAVYAQIAEIDPGEGFWPFADTVLVVGSISAGDDLRKEMKPLDPTEILPAKDLGISPALLEKHQSPIWAVWWD